MLYAIELAYEPNKMEDIVEEDIVEDGRYSIGLSSFISTTGNRCGCVLHKTLNNIHLFFSPME